MNARLILFMVLTLLFLNLVWLRQTHPVKQANLGLGCGPISVGAGFKPALDAACLPLRAVGSSSIPIHKTDTSNFQLFLPRSSSRLKI